eukprot:PhF_6_TR32367/c0_g1_i1/m.48002/K08857/NEK1_4_5; NIMA (never in mitosis gene a)-related kinase 1/4/5
MDFDELSQMRMDTDPGKRGVFHQRYSVIQQLGKGTFGDVFLVHPKSSQSKRLVAKQIRITCSTERKKALQEVKILSKLHHPNVVKYVESVEDAHYLYIITEYASGGDLRKLIREAEGVPFPEERIMTWFSQMLLALQHLHQCKLLHRDLKPANVFLSSSGFVKLGDFGMSKSLKGGAGFANTVCGTPCYFSPELAHRLPYNQKSDVWSLGCILYELMSFRHAFSGVSLQELMDKITTGKFDPPDPDHRYSPFLTEVVNSILQTDVDKRPGVSDLLNLEPVKKHLLYIKEVLIPKISKERKSSSRSNRSRSAGKSTTTESEPSPTRGSRNGPGSPTPHSPPGSPKMSLAEAEALHEKFKDLTPAQMKELARSGRKKPTTAPQAQTPSEPPILTPTSSDLLPPLMDFDDQENEILEEMQQSVVNAVSPQPDLDALKLFIGAELPPTTGRRALALLARVTENANVAFETRCEVYDEMMLLLGPRYSVRFQATLMTVVFNE